MSVRSTKTAATLERDYRFVRSPFNAFKVSAQYPIKQFFGLFTDWKWVCQYGQEYFDFDGGSHFVAAQFDSVRQARKRLCSVIEMDGTVFVK